MIARWVLRIAEPSDVIDVAHSLLDAGTYTYSLGELATLPPGWDWYTFERFFHGAVRELGCATPDEQAAIVTYVSEHLENAYEGRCSPRELLQACGPLGWPDRERLLLVARCQELNERYCEWDAETDLMAPLIDAHEHERRLQDLDRRVLSFADRWVREHYRDTIRPAERTPNVIAIAQTIDAERAFDRLPILADALEDAGCTNADVLEHCRQPPEHARRCWVVDLLLGKS